MLIENSSCICFDLWYTYCKTHDIRVICPKNQNVFTLTGVLTMSEFIKRQINECKFYLQFEAISNAISNADKDFLQVIDLKEILKDGEYTHDTYEIKYQKEYKVPGTPLVLSCQPVGTFKYPGIVVSKEDYVRGALIAEARLVHGWNFISITRPPQSGKTALLWCVHHHLKELARKLLQKSLYTAVCIQKGLNGLRLDIAKDLERFCEHEEYIKIEHLLGYKKIDKFIESNAKKDDNFYLIAFDEIQIAHNQNGNADKLTRSKNCQWVNNNKPSDEFDVDTIKSIENISSSNCLILTISATATAPNKLISDRLARDVHPKIIQAFCEPNSSYEGFKEMVADGRIVNLPAGSVTFSSKKVQGIRRHDTEISNPVVVDYYRDWLMSDENSIAVQRINCKENEIPFLRKILTPLTDVDSDKYVPYSKREGLKIILLNGDKDTTPGAITCDEFMPDNVFHWEKYRNEVVINKQSFNRYNFHLSFRDKLFNFAPSSKTLILVCQGLTVGERVEVKKHVKLWVEIGSNPNFLLQSVGRMFGYPNDESKKFTGKILVNMDSTQKNVLALDAFYDFYDLIKTYGVSHIFPDTGYLTESGFRTKSFRKLKIVRDPREINAHRVFHGVLDNNVKSHIRENTDEETGIFEHWLTPDEFRKHQFNTYIKKFDVISDTDYRLKDGESLEGFRRQVHTIGTRNLKIKKQHPKETNFWTDYGIMQLTGDTNLVDYSKRNAYSGEPMPQSYVNKQIAVITKPSDLCDQWDLKYFQAFSKYLVSIGQKPISEAHPVYIEVEKDYRDVFVNAQFTKASTFQEEDHFTE